MAFLQAGGLRDWGAALRKTTGALEDSELKIRKQCILSAEMANSISDSVNRIIASRSREVMIILYSELIRPHL